MTILVLGAGGKLDRQIELCAHHCDAIVRSQCNLESAAQRRAVKRGDDGLTARFETIADVEQRWRLRRLAELVDVRARDEIAARTDDQNSPDRAVRFGGIDRGDESAPDLHAERIHRRIVGGYEQYVTAHFMANRSGGVVRHH
jgi:hypothetical protein